MTELEAASKAVCRAIEAEDLDWLAEALEERSRLLVSGAEPTELTLTLGEEGVRLLGVFKQRLALLASRAPLA